MRYWPWSQASSWKNREYLFQFWTQWPVHLWFPTRLSSYLFALDPLRFTSMSLPWAAFGPWHNSSSTCKLDGCSTRFVGWFLFFASSWYRWIAETLRKLDRDLVEADWARFPGRIELGMMGAICFCTVVSACIFLLQKLLRGRLGSGKCQNYQQYQIADSPSRIYQRSVVPASYFSVE